MSGMMKPMGRVECNMSDIFGDQPRVMANSHNNGVAFRNGRQ
jgi:hypothetical protein